MINLFYNQGNVYVYNVEDWIKLRKTYRIIGEIIGNTHFIPSLPLKLETEEVLLLIDLKVVNIYQYNLDEYTRDPQNHVKQKKFEENLLHNEKIQYKKLRKAQLEGMLDKIVERRQKQGEKKTPDEILEEELNKSCSVNSNNLIWPTLLQHNFDVKTLQVINKETIEKNGSSLNTLVYKDLWNRNYFITQGTKFGGDFLVYFGDPVVYHAIFIIKCVERTKSISPHEIVAFGRLGNSVKKRAVLASVDKDNKVTYITINWIDS